MICLYRIGINEVTNANGARPKPSRSRSRENNLSNRNRVAESEEKLAYSERKVNERGRVENNSSPSHTSTTTVRLTEAEGSSLYIGGRTTTPAPPTTPDPGSGMFLLSIYEFISKIKKKHKF